jgi:hypothetical protein
MTDLKLHTSATFVDPSFIDSAQGLTTNFPKGLLGFKNNGVGLDLGAQYYLTERIAVSASLIDLGFIRWNSNATTFTSKHPGQWTTFLHRFIQFREFSSGNGRQPCRSIECATVKRGLYAIIIHAILSGQQFQAYKKS